MRAVRSFIITHTYFCLMTSVPRNKEQLLIRATEVKFCEPQRGGSQFKTPLIIKTVKSWEVA